MSWQARPLRYLILILMGFERGYFATVIHDCNHMLHGVYNIRFCVFDNITVIHDAEEIVFRSEFPRPYNFEFHNSQLTEIPRILFTSFPEMQNLEANKCGIENINKYTFENARELRYMNISNNKMSVLNNFVFKGCNKLIRLDVSHNTISEVKEKAFDDAGQLEHLDLSFNWIEKIDDQTFLKLPLLGFISLADNRLSELSDRIFWNSSSLTSINLSNNYLTKLGDEFLKNFNFLRSFYIDNNELEMLKVPRSVSRLQASNNKLKNIIFEDYQTSQIYYLILSNNSMTDISNITNLVNLTILDLSFNTVGALNLTSFLKLKKLFDLNLEATNISDLEHGIFAQQTKLRRLDISYNNLRFIDLDVLASSPLLEKLYIDGNGLKSISYESIRELFPNLTYVGLFSNEWNCTYLIKMVRYFNNQQITVSQSKNRGVISDMTNIQGIYCANQNQKPKVIKIEKHSNENILRPKDEDEQLDAIIKEITDTSHFDYKTVVEIIESIRSLNDSYSKKFAEFNHISTLNSNLPASCHYQAFIILILTAILVLNVIFVLFIYHSVVARSSVNNLMKLRTSVGNSVQTTLEHSF